ncbi:G-type lectin S-receptor-like serine/threonine-protein kinase B120 [Rhodamnia argentea]|uniref:Receptor-like serine/threonine-protein kinase n=1 Tax=Rhodamnia argentea TaxID=178133 RepID=A0A8B8MVM3_9MYRT|nr:G-type lectin S-receptor-like serine/threonine-protein kinase B120 [Rhodamnia argentea]
MLGASVNGGMPFTGKNRASFFVFSLLSVWSSLFSCSRAANSISRGQLVRAGETLISSSGIFELGFFSPANSSLRYVGIWYHKISVKTVVWVANRESPVSDESGVLTVSSDGNLVVLDGPDRTVWSSGINFSSVPTSSTAVLMDEGNLVLLASEDADSASADGDVSNSYWQSFEHPTDTYLPGMRVRVNSAAGENRAFRSWRSSNDPSPGNFSLGVDPRVPPQIVIWGQSGRLWRSGHWNGLIFTGVPNMTSSFQYGFRLSSAEADGSMYFTYTPLNSSHLLMFHILWNGTEEQLGWDETSNEWIVLQEQPAKECDLYNKCGQFAICNEMDSPKCSCMEGFRPTSPDQWNKGNWSAGCARKTNLQCQDNIGISAGDGGRMDGFLELDGVKLPDFADYVSATSGDECQVKCLENCSCKAYTFVRGTWCMLWSADLIDVQHFAVGGLTLQIRLAYSDLGTKSKISNLFIIITVLVGAFVLGVAVWLLWRFKDNLKGFWIFNRKDKELPLCDYIVKNEEPYADMSGPDKQAGGPDIPVFNFSSIEAATNVFSEENILGLGGFGPVYKGKLPGGQEIAVKRLSRKSSQGVEEFTNEVKVIAKLQHRNLVRLLGFCVQGEDKMLVYEYMPNGSLDYFIFDPAKRAQLDWKKRFEIIEGIARGLLYLHRDSRLRIVHRDLKAGNILLDEDMNPKISDFGIAKIFNGDKNELSTERMVGTRGYMSPEYAMEGLFSFKSDVYSFGVLLLEIISGETNIGFRTPEHFTLIGHAWHHWNEGKVMELIDPCIRDTCSADELLRCIQVGLLCVQESAIDRLDMPNVVRLLESETAGLPLPKPPRSISTRGSIHSYSSGETAGLPSPKPPSLTSNTGSMDTYSSFESQEIESWNGVTVSSGDGR